MMKIMAIDYGKVHIGIALTDPLGIIAQPYLTISYKSQKDLIKRLKFICAENNVGLILIGNPLHLDGKDSEMSDEIKSFAARLKKSLNIEIQLWDERYTSKLATNILKDYGIKNKNLDQISASLMLEEYLRQKDNFTAEC
uniref:Putative pre-16S rRNA nuclease n=1 Tax=candidate division WOR-3 bacterium TaxID=2052148 RepID=A0A7C6EM93_UNCW3